MEYTIHLNPIHSFENFIVGETNQFVYTACKVIAENNKKIVFNPLFIHGNSGLGKTHLVQAIGNALKNELDVMYISFEEFLNDFTEHLKYNTMHAFRETFRECDVLIIDDIQFISNKKKTQDELFFTFDVLHSENKQIIFTSDVHPKKLSNIENRLKDRFQMGLIAKVDPLNLDIKLKIIKKIAEVNSIILPTSVVNYIAAHTDDSAREITGIINKLHMYHILLHERITLELAMKVMEDTLKEVEVTLNNIMEAVAIEMNIKPSEICSKSKRREVVYSKRIATYLSRELTDNSMKEIAAYFNYKDHSAVSHAVKKFTTDLDKDVYLKTLTDRLMNKITT